MDGLRGEGHESLFRFYRVHIASNIERGILHPGVEAFGYVKMTMPLLLSSRSFFKVTFSPSFVSISPPKLSRLTVSPTLIVVRCAVADPLAEDSPFWLEADDLTELAFFAGGGGAAAGSEGVLRLRSSTIPMMFGLVRYYMKICC